MRLLFLALLFAIAVTLVPCAAQTPDTWRDPFWLHRTIDRMDGLPSDAPEPQCPHARVKTNQPDSDYFGMNTVYEARRLFGTDLSGDEPHLGRIAMKALMVLPMLGKSNATQLMLTSRLDIAQMLARRAALHRIRRAETPIATAPGEIAIDTHVHTCVSPDSLADISSVLLSASRRGLSGVAITDHNSIEGSRRAIRIARRLIRRHRLPPTFFVIPGEEVGSTDGHIIALFISHEIGEGMSAAQTVDAIHAQGGLAIAAHPMLGHSLGALAVTVPFDAVETVNSAEEMHYLLAKGDLRQQRADFYAGVRKPRIGASDAHDPQIVGLCYSLVKSEASPEGVKDAILHGRVRAEAGISYEEEKSLMRRGLPHLLASMQREKEPSTTAPTHERSANLAFSVLPMASMEWTKRF